ncbi:hypothetical protein MMC19_004732 [Ptychographa xylographoides]|nr:hypothetical protein [Ptychographa xylographoides]
MAPLPSIDSVKTELSVSSLELDRLSSPNDFTNLALRKRSSFPLLPSLTTSLAKDWSPLDVGPALQVRNAPAPQYTPGVGAVPAAAINNNAVLALFGLLSASLVIASIWFFFWAKNGGFRFRKGDWDDYKSTVLRRKGPDGKTLSNATKSTELGGGSIVGSFDEEDFAVEKGRRGKKKGKQNKNSRDNDVRAYRHEKPARVGGLNREADGTYTDFTATDPSETSTTDHHKHNLTGDKPGRSYTPNKPQPRQFSYNPGAESAFSGYTDESSQPLRASPAHNRHSNTSTPAHTPTRSRQPSPTKRTAPHHHQSNRGSVPGSYTDPIDFNSRYSASEAETEQTRNTKAYFHPIPGLSKPAGVSANGFRRGGGRRRDSLSDSEGETETAMS